MAMEWDAEEFVPPKPVPVKGDKWDGEDEDDDVKDNWEESDHEEKKENPEGGKAGNSDKVAAYQRPKKKPLAERIAEKQAKKKTEEESETQKPKELTEEEKLAERLRLRKIQEEADLKVAMDIFGSKEGAGSIDKMYPVTEEEYIAFKDALVAKINNFSKDKYFGTFLDKLITDLVVDLPSEDHKRISTNLSQLYHEKERLKREQEKKKKKKQKAVVKVDRAEDVDVGLSGEALDYEDFI